MAITQIRTQHRELMNQIAELTEEVRQERLKRMLAEDLARRAVDELQKCREDYEKMVGLIQRSLDKLEIT